MTWDVDVYDLHAEALVRLATVLVGPDRAPEVVSRVVLQTLVRRPLADLDNPAVVSFTGGCPRGSKQEPAGSVEQAGRTCHSCAHDRYQVVVGDADEAACCCVLRILGGPQLVRNCGHPEGPTVHRSSLFEYVPASDA